MVKFSTYQEVLNYLYSQLPMFQRVGDIAYKKDLSNTLALCQSLNYPQHQFKSIHIGGTNGKGSCSHMIAAVLQAAGYKTGLYTSPHLKDFTERVKVNGQPVGEQAVMDFMHRILPVIEEIHPSFFEITVALAFDYFAQEKVDIAVIEVGMGGRLDSTNVIQPEVAMITNISDDHKQWLGDTLEKIAMEKAGIIKDHTPVVIAETQPEVSHVFDQKAREKNAKLFRADQEYEVFVRDELWSIERHNTTFLKVNLGLTGAYQRNNLPGVLKVLEIITERGFDIEKEHLKKGLEKVTEMTGLKGRWQILGKQPFIVCDVGHNIAGVKAILQQIDRHSYHQLHMIWGMVEDKNADDILALLPKEARYYFCQSSIPRAKKADKLKLEAARYGLKGEVITDVNQALESVKAQADENDFIFIGGSNFVVAELHGL